MGKSITLDSIKSQMVELLDIAEKNNGVVPRPQVFDIAHRRIERAMHETKSFVRQEDCHKCNITRGEVEKAARAALKQHKGDHVIEKVRNAAKKKAGGKKLSRKKAVDSSAPQQTFEEQLMATPEAKAELKPTQQEEKKTLHPLGIVNEDAIIDLVDKRIDIALNNSLSSRVDELVKKRLAKVKLVGAY